MPQEFQVLCCCSCHMYQVQQLKKSNKWNCKVCNEKQSVKQIYGRGNGRECREHVQKLNALAGLKDSLKAELDTKQGLSPVDNNLLQNHDDIGMPGNTVSSVPEGKRPSNHKSLSKWSSFLDNSDNEDSDNDGQDLTSIVPRNKDVSIFPNKKFKSLEGKTDTPGNSKLLMSTGSNNKKHSQKVSSKWDAFT